MVSPTFLSHHRHTVESEKNQDLLQPEVTSGSEEAPTFLGLDFKNFSFFPRGEVFEVGTVLCCSVRQQKEEEREEGEMEGVRE